jgi:hypothetical protein
MSQNAPQLGHCDQSDLKQGHLFEELQALKEEYNNIQKDKAEGTVLRAKAKWVEHGEKNSKFFLQLEKHNHNVKHIKTLCTGKGIITKPKEILDEEKLFYSELYSEKTDKNKL